MNGRYYWNALTYLPLALPVDRNSSGEEFPHRPLWLRILLITVVILGFGLVIFTEEAIDILTDGTVWVGLAVALVIVAATLGALRLGFGRRLVGYPWLYAYFFSRVALPWMLLAAELSAADVLADALWLYLLDGGIAWLFLLWFRQRGTMTPLWLAALHLVLFTGFVIVTQGSEAVTWLILPASLVQAVLLARSIADLAAVRQFLKC